MLRFALAALAVWRLSSLLVNEAGPADVFLKIRNLCGVCYDEYSRPYAKNVLGGILSCVWCCSVWVGWSLAWMVKPSNFAYYVFDGLALSACAIIIDEVLAKVSKDDSH